MADNKMSWAPSVQSALAGEEEAIRFLYQKTLTDSEKEIRKFSIPMESYPEVLKFVYTRLFANLGTIQNEPEETEEPAAAEPTETATLAPTKTPTPTPTPTETPKPLEEEAKETEAEAEEAAAETEEAEQETEAEAEKETETAAENEPIDYDHWDTVYADKLASYRSEADTVGPAVYAYYDLNDDGTPELLVQRGSTGYYVNFIHTTASEEPVILSFGLGNGTSSSDSYITVDGEIIRGSNNRTYISFDDTTVYNGGLECLRLNESGDGTECILETAYFEKQQSDGTAIESRYYSDKMQQNEISEEEYQSIQSTIYDKEILTPDWHEL